MAGMLILIFAVTSVCVAGMEKMNPKATKASSLIGHEIVNHQGEKLGKITDLVINRADGRIAFAVLSHGDSKNLIAVPISAFAFSEGKVALDISRDRLATAPSFDAANWPNISDRKTLENSYRFFGASPYWEERGMKKEMQREMEEEKGHMEYE